MTSLRGSVKALVLALVAGAVCVLPMLSLPAFLYVCGAAAAIVGLIYVGMLLGLVFDLAKLYVEFRGFEQRTGSIARRIFGRREKRFARLVRR